jgi:hypothetical protein
LTFVWLSCQAASLSAFVVAASGRDLAESIRTCFQAATSDECPMHGPDGQPCPMHRDGGSTGADEKSCAIRALDGPDAALANLLPVPGVLVAQASDRAGDDRSSVTPAPVRFPSAPSALDTPPPRS